MNCLLHDVTEWKHFRIAGPLWGEPPVTGGFSSQSKSRGALVFSLICAWTNGWKNNRDPGDLMRHRAHYDDTVMPYLMASDISSMDIYQRWLCNFIHGTNESILKRMIWILRVYYWGSCSLQGLFPLDCICANQLDQMYNLFVKFSPFNLTSIRAWRVLTWRGLLPMVLPIVNLINHTA